MKSLSLMAQQPRCVWELAGKVYGSFLKRAVKRAFVI